MYTHTQITLRHIHTETPIHVTFTTHTHIHTHSDTYTADTYTHSRPHKHVHTHILRRRLRHHRSGRKASVSEVALCLCTRSHHWTGSCQPWSVGKGGREWNTKPGEVETFRSSPFFENDLGKSENVQFCVEFKSSHLEVCQIVHNKLQIRQSARPGFRSWFYHVRDLGHTASFTSLSPSFLICEMEITPASHSCCDHLR